MGDAQSARLSLDPAELARAFGQDLAPDASGPADVTPEDGLEAVWERIREAGEHAGLGLLAASVVTGLKARVREVASRLRTSARVPVALSGPWMPATPGGAVPRWLGELLEEAGSQTDDTGAEAVGVVVGPLTSDISSGDTACLRVAIDLRRPGPRLAEAAEVLAAALHPARCPDLVARHAARVARPVVPPEN